MDIVTLGAALNGSAEYVNSHFKGGSNIQIVDNPDGTQTINASGAVSSEDTVARADIAAIKDGETLDSFGDVETALGDKADTSTTYTKTEVDTALNAKADVTDIPTVPITAIQKNGTGIAPVSGTVNITVPTQASDINAATATQGGKADTAIQGIKVNSSTVNPDSNKIVSITIPTSAADVSAIPTSAKGANSGVAELDATGKVPASQLPSYVDDVIEGYYYNSKFYEDSAHTTEITGTTGKIYVDLSTNKTYRWSGSGYTEISASLALGTTSSTAYRGDRGTTAYTHATDSSRLTTAKSSGLYKVASTSQGHIASLTVVQKSDITALGIPAQDTTVGSGIVLTGYEESTTGGQAVSATDTVNEAIGKIEKRVSDNENNILYNTNNGVKNLYNLTKMSGTYSTVIFIVNSDKTVTVNGTASPANSVFNLGDWTCTKAGTYVVSGAPSGGSWAPSPNTYRIRVAVNGTWKGDDVGNGFALTLAVGDVVNLQINTSTSYTANNLVFKPMISIKSLYDVDPTYQPYALSNAELTALADLAVPAIPSTTTLASYAGTLAKGYHTAFIVNGQNPSDSPISDNCFVDFFVYSANTAEMRVFPTYSAYAGEFFVRTKVSGSWGGWYKFQGTAVT